MSFWKRAAVGTALAAWGCGPPEIVPVAPPGLESGREVPEKEEDAAQAIGEARTNAALAGAPLPKAEAPALEPAPPTPAGQSRTTASGLTYETLKPGTGPEARPGQYLSLHYTGTLPDGTVFDSSRDRGPFPLQLGVSRVIPGWHQGIAGMRVGERRKLTIPPQLAYGAEGRPPKIPPNATLIFEVELLDAK